MGLLIGLAVIFIGLGSIGSHLEIRELRKRVTALEKGAPHHGHG